MEYSKKINECKVYSDYVNNGFILPQKNKYTMKDFKMLRNEGFDILQARFICICSSIYHFNISPSHISKIFFKDCDWFMVYCFTRGL